MNVSTAEFETIFPTFLMRHDDDEATALNAELERLILDEAGAVEDPGIFTNVGGWHSPKTYQSSEQEAVRTLMQRFLDLADEMMRRAGSTDHPGFEIEAWANVNGEMHYNEMHCHRGCIWSGVYYVAVPDHCADEPLKGAIEFLDPRPAAILVGLPGAAFEVRKYIAPRAGRMLLFPSWLQHMVHPFRDPGRRISVACNLMFSSS